MKNEDSRIPYGKLKDRKICDGVVFSRYSQDKSFANDISIFNLFE